MKWVERQFCNVRWLIAVACIGALLLGCATKSDWKLVDITGVMPLEFSLDDDSGHAVTAASYRGDVVLLYFGYTNCGDVCPATLARLASALATLGPDTARIKVLFVSVDPARDTPAVLTRYLRHFGPAFVGLRGDDTRLLQLNKRYRVTYEVSHSSAVFIFDGQGRARLIAESPDTPAAIAHDLRKLLDGA
jgi:protein SCO1/2